MKNKLILLLAIFLLPFSVYAEDIVTDNPLPDVVVSDEDDSMTIDESPVDYAYSYINPNTQYTVVFDDKANLLTEEEIIELKNAMIPLTEFGHIAFISTNENTGNEFEYAGNFYHTHFQAESGTVLLIDMDNRKICIFSDGANYDVITESKAYSITDNVYTYASDGDYYKVASLTFDQVYRLLDGQKIAEPMRYTSIIFISLILSFLLNFIIVLARSRARKASASEIIKKCDIDFHVDNVKGYKTGTHMVYSPVSDSSSGGSSGGGGGGGGGGGSSGGGGSHSF